MLRLISDFFAQNHASIFVLVASLSYKCIKTAMKPQHVIFDMYDEYVMQAQPFLSLHARMQRAG